jgi:hypothetical protein
MNKEPVETLFLELSLLEDRGITIWMEGALSNPQDVADRMQLHEDTSYMRDYIFNEGVLTEIHFDRIMQQTNR